jgi:hypothetical protein
MVAKNVSREQAMSCDRFWSCRIAPSERLCLSEGIYRGVLVIKNMGPGTIVVESTYSRSTNIKAHEIRLISVAGSVHIETSEDGASSIAFEYVPTLK